MSVNDVLPRRSFSEQFATQEKGGAAPVPQRAEASPAQAAPPAAPSGRASRPVYGIRFFFRGGMSRFIFINPVQDIATAYDAARREERITITCNTGMMMLTGVRMESVMTRLETLSLAQIHIGEQPYEGGAIVQDITWLSFKGEVVAG